MITKLINRICKPCRFITNYLHNSKIYSPEDNLPFILDILVWV